MCIKILLAILLRSIGHAVLMLVSPTVIRFYGFHINGRRLRQFTYKVTCVALARDVYTYTSSAVLRARFYGDLTSQANNKTHLSMDAKCPMFMPDFNQLWISLTNFHKSSPISNLTGLCPVGAVLVHEDGHNEAR